jgi:hypothetical protein
MTWSPNALVVRLRRGLTVAAARCAPRVQQVVDRRFNRRRHDAAQTIEAFGTRLRDEIDLDTLSAELLAVVTQTMQPDPGINVASPSAGHPIASGGLAG